MSSCTQENKSEQQANTKIADTTIKAPLTVVPVVDSSNLYDSNKIFDVIKYDLNQDGISDTIVLKMPAPEDGIGIFSKAIFKLSGQAPITLKAKDVWDAIDSSFIRINAIKSNLAYIINDNKQVFVVLFGFQYGSGRDYFTVIKINDNKLKVLYDNEMNGPVGFERFGENSELYFVGRTGWEEWYTDSLGNFNHISSYFPFEVFELKDTMKVKPSLTEEYNKKHYVWAGLKFDDDIRVWHNYKDGIEICKLVK